MIEYINLLGDKELKTSKITTASKEDILVFCRKNVNAIYIMPMRLTQEFLLCKYDEYFDNICGARYKSGDLDIVIEALGKVSNTELIQRTVGYIIHQSIIQALPSKISCVDYAKGWWQEITQSGKPLQYIPLDDSTKITNLDV